jgi:hypothetical protein
MLKCPFCQFDNEDGVLFCEQCKSDLAGVTQTAPHAVMAGSVVPRPDETETVPLAEFAPIPLAPELAPTPIPLDVPLPTPTPVDLANPPPPPVMAPEVGVVPVLETEFGTAAATHANAETLVSPVLPGGPAPLQSQPSVLSPDAQPRLLVLRGQKRNEEYPLFEGLNFIGRADEKPVDIDLEDQEPPDRVWCSRQHACVKFEDGKLTVEDLNSSNGTFVNRARLYPGQPKPLAVGDVIQIGNVHMKVIV